MTETTPFVFDSGYTTWTNPMTRTFLKRFKESLRDIFAEMKLQEDSPFTIGDFGCHDGSSTVDLIAYMTVLLKERNGRDIPIHIIYEDLPFNDFNALVKHMAAENKNIFMSMCPTDFFEQCLPDRTFDLIISSCSVHFLSTSNICYKKSIYKFPDCTKEELTAVSEQAAIDWQNFLLLRAKEMKSGGSMLLMMPAEDPEMNYGQSKIHLQIMWTSITEEWRQLKTEGLLSETEYEAANYTGYYRSEAELKVPFGQDSPVTDAGLYLESLDIVHRRNYSSQMFEGERQKNGMSNTWVDIFVTTIRQWSEYIFVGALSQRTPESRKAVIDTLYERLKKHLKEEDPQSPQLDNILAYLVIRKH